MRLWLIFFLLLGWPDWAMANAPANNETKLPYYAALRSDEVNMRSGPGTRFPIQWVYRRQGLPVQVIAQFEHWRRVRDFEGTEGWIQKQLLTRERHALTLSRSGTGTSLQPLFWRANPQSPRVAMVAPLSVGRIQACTQDWCELQFGEARGFMPKSQFWGTDANEIID